MGSQRDYQYHIYLPNLLIDTLLTESKALSTATRRVLYIYVHVQPDKFVESYRSRRYPAATAMGKSGGGNIDGLDQLSLCGTCPICWLPVVK